MSLIILPKALDVGFFAKDSQSPSFERETSVSTPVETHPVVREVNPGPKAVQLTQGGVSSSSNNVFAAFMDENMLVQYR